MNTEDLLENIEDFSESIEDASEDNSQCDNMSFVSSIFSDVDCDFCER
jgi:hypothetical protein